MKEGETMKLQDMCGTVQCVQMFADFHLNKESNFLYFKDKEPIKMFKILYWIQMN